MSGPSKAMHGARIGTVGFGIASLDWKNAEERVMARFWLSFISCRESLHLFRERLSLFVFESANT